MAMTDAARNIVAAAPDAALGPGPDAAPGPGPDAAPGPGPDAAPDAAPVSLTGLSALHGSPAMAARLRRRRAADSRLKFYGVAAIALAALALAALLWSVVGKAGAALTEHYAVIEVDLSPQALGIAGSGDLSDANFDKAVKRALKARFPFVKGRSGRRALYGIVSGGAGFELREQALADPALIGAARPVRLLMSDDADLYLKGAYGRFAARPVTGALTILRDGDEVTLISDSDDFAPWLAMARSALLDRARTLHAQAARQENGRRVTHGKALRAPAGPARDALLAEAQGFAAARDALILEANALELRAAREGGEEALNADLPSLLAAVNGGWVKATRIAGDRLTGTALAPPDGDAAPAGGWRLLVNPTPESARKLSDLQAALIETLGAQGAVDSAFNWRFFTASDSRDPELAGIRGALAGSFWTMLVTFAVAFPIGVLSAIYLEEFAPKNRLTDFVEVNINNLAAVPSIVFGLLGLSIFLTGFHVTLFGESVTIGGFAPRSAPLAGGLVLALMTLPTIIIAARAAIRAVPPSIRDGALALGASPLQVSFHHVLPLAMPGVLTGAIIGMAQALGETAPLIMIGMVAFIVDVPGGVMDPATAMPVQIYRWSDFPERAFEARTAAAICVLLAFLMAMNLLAVFLRKRFERRW